jgi:hypothetical protein
LREWIKDILGIEKMNKTEIKEEFYTYLED